MDLTPYVPYAMVAVLAWLGWSNRDYLLRLLPVGRDAGGHDRRDLIEALLDARDCFQQAGNEVDAKTCQELIGRLPCDHRG